MNNLSGDDTKRLLFLYISSLPWEFPLDYLQRYAKQMGCYGPVIYYCPHVKLITYRDFYDRPNTRKELLEATVSLFQNFTIFLPFAILPFSRLKLFDTINSHFASFMLKVLLFFKSRRKKIYLYTTIPLDRDFMQAICYDHLIYDCMEYPADFRDKKKDIIIWDAHKKTCSNSDYVFVNSTMGMKVCNPYARKVFKVPAGFNLSGFFRKSQLDDDLSKKFQNIKKPRIGFVGYTFVRMDAELLLSLVARCADMSFIFIGPEKTRFLDYSYQRKDSIKKFYRNWETLVKQSNVFVIGELSKERIAQCLQLFDVCIIPYKLIEPAAFYSNTIKAYEYLAAGKPVVSTPLEPLKDLKDLIYFAKSPEEFENKIRKALTFANSESDVERRRNVALFHDVANKAKIVVNTLTQR